MADFGVDQKPVLTTHSPDLTLLLPCGRSGGGRLWGGCGHGRGGGGGGRSRVDPRGRQVLLPGARGPPHVHHPQHRVTLHAGRLLPSQGEIDGMALTL